MAEIKAAYRLKKGMEEVAKAKINAERERQGLPPLMTWYERCFLAIKSCISRTCLKVFCPCMVHDLEKQPCCNAKICRDGTYQNQTCKSILGFFGGIVLSFLWFLLMVYNLQYSPMTATVTSAFIGLVLTLGLAFSLNARCLTLLVLPQLFSSKGRAVLLAMTFVLVLNGPMNNFRHNMHVLSETATCGQQMSQNATKEVVDAALAPVKDIIDSLRSMLIALAHFAEKLRDAVLKVRDLFVEIVAAVRRVFGWLDNMVNVCNDNMGAPYRKCVRAIRHGVDDCKEKLKAMSFLCEIAKATTHVCHVARVGELLCAIPAAMKRLVVEKIKGYLTIAINDVYEMFYFNVTLKYHYDLKMSQSKTAGEVREDIQKEIEQRMRPFMSVASWSNVALVVTLMWLVMKAVLYRRKYLSKDSADNVYINLKLQEIDNKREEANKECILPLNWKESCKYVTTTSIILARHERRKLILGLIILAGSGLHIGFQLGCDYGLYWMLTMIRTHGELRVHNDVPSHLQMHVQGEGVLADIYRAIITQFDPADRQQIGIDTTPCLPNPRTPDYGTYKTVGIIFAVCIFLVLTESYGLRLRHVIAGSYYPERAKFRAVWLYNNILRRRGGFLKHMRRQMRRNYETEQAKENFSMLNKLAAKFPCVNKLMRAAGMRQIFCLCCGLPGKPDDREGFKHCDNHECKGVYCNDCFTDINNLCTVCLKPVDYGDFSDFSEERDSSDEEQRDETKMATMEEGKPQHAVDAASNHSYHVKPPVDAASNHGYHVQPPVDAASNHGYHVQPPVDTASNHGYHVQPPVDTASNHGYHVQPKVDVTDVDFAYQYKPKDLAQWDDWDADETQLPPPPLTDRVSIEIFDQHVGNNEGSPALAPLEFPYQ